MKNVVGAQLYTVRDYCKDLKGVAETAKKVAKIGYKAVQLSGFGPADPKDVAKIMADNGLTVASTHTSWEQFLNDLDAVIAEHKLYNCVHPAIGGLPGEYRGPDGVKRFVDELTPIAEKLAAEGMDFSYHNHNHELARYDFGGQTKTWLAALYETASPAILKAELDTYWVQAGGADPIYWVKKCAGREPLLHLKDMAITPTREQRYAEVGEGNLNWEGILAAAQESGVEWYLVEQDLSYDRNPFDALAISYRNLVAMGLS